MTLEQLRHFVAAAEQGSFSRGAEALFVSHSTISRSVAALESEFGVTLFIRGNRSLECTRAGEVLLAEGRELLRRADALRGRMEDVRPRSQLRMVSVGFYAPGFFELCHRFQQEHPEVEFQMERGGQLAILDKLRSGAADLSVTYSYSWPEEEGLEALVLDSGRFCALVSHHHPLAGREYVTAEELGASELVLGENPFRGPRGRTAPPPADRLERDVSSVLLQVKTGGGLAILPEHAAAEFGQGCVRLPIRGEGTRYQLLLGWRRENTTPGLEKAVAFFRRALAEGKDGGSR